MKGMPGGFNMQSMIKQAQKMQKEMEKKQEELANKTIEVTSGGGAIKVIVTGKRELREIKIDPSVIDPDDVEMLEDLVLSAVNEGIRQADEMQQKEMGALTGGAMPGLF